MAAGVDTAELETKVRNLYRQVAEEPRGHYHFEMGRGLAERLGYPTDLLEHVPADALESFAGVGFFFDLAALQTGEIVVDLGSGSGTDSFIAAEVVGVAGRVVGVDFTVEQLNKARRLAAEAGLAQVEFREGRIENLPMGDSSVDCVISNGVVNLSPDKQRVFDEAARVLRPGGRLALADIVSDRPLSRSIVENADLWASCIGGAAQRDQYHEAIESTGLTVTQSRPNSYEFTNARARNAGETYGVRSISLLAVKPTRPNRPQTTPS